MDMDERILEAATKEADGDGLSDDDLITLASDLGVPVKRVERVIKSAGWKFYPEA